MTTVFDAAGKGSAKACWALMRRARADKFESASSAAKPPPFQEVAFCSPEKPDTYWSAPSRAERPVISVVEIGYVRRSEFTSASLIGRLGQAHSGYPPAPVRCRSRARASLRTRHQGPSIMGFEDEVEQSFGRPCRQCNGRLKRTYDLTSSIVPRGTSFHRWVELDFLLSHLILHSSQAAAT